MTRHVVPFRLSLVAPAWFLVFVGFVVASVTSPAFDALPVGRILLYAGALGYALALPVVVYRMLKGDALTAAAAPTVAIFVAPPSLVLVGYLAVTPAKQVAVVYALLAVAAASLLYVLACLPKIVKDGFHPTYGALTFPVVITAIALKQSNVFLASTPAGPLVPKVAVIAMDAFATAMVLFVLAHYAAHLMTPVRED